MCKSIIVVLTHHLLDVKMIEFKCYSCC